MYTENQLEKIALVKEKWAVWEKSRVSVFTREDHHIINELRTINGLAPVVTSCSACFMDAVRELINKMTNY